MRRRGCLGHVPLVLALSLCDGGCWGATFSAPQINTTERFKAKSD